MTFRSPLAAQRFEKCPWKIPKHALGLVFLSLSRPAGGHVCWELTWHRASETLRSAGAVE